MFSKDHIREIVTALRNCPQSIIVDEIEINSRNYPVSIPTLEKEAADVIEELVADQMHYKLAKMNYRQRLEMFYSSAEIQEIFDEIVKDQNDIANLRLSERKYV
jgi:hypothetical protein